MFLENYTLLYVEDDKITQDTMVEILQPFVKTLYVANNGEEGLELFNKNMPDIILTDINMPKMNGLEMSKEIKKINPSQAIILATACDKLSDLQEAISLGIDKYIIKPITDIQLIFDSLEVISERLHDHKKIHELEEILQMQSKLSAVSDMIGNISHQWRQPLAAINSSANNLQVTLSLGHTPKNEDILKHTETVVRHTDYLSTTISKFREFFKSGDAKRKFNLKETIIDLTQLFKDSYASHNIEIILDLEPYELIQSENQLVQAMVNIFQNAKEAHLSNENKGQKYLFVTLKVINNTPTIMIKDNAGGIQPGIIDKIFDPYFTTKHQSTGVGISLYMSSQIIAKYFNGSIHAFNEIFDYNGITYKGANFTITL